MIFCTAGIVVYSGTALPTVLIDQFNDNLTKLIVHLLHLKTSKTVVFTNFTKTILNLLPNN